MLKFDKKLLGDIGALEFFIEDMLDDIEYLFEEIGIDITPDICFYPQGGSSCICICLKISDLYETRGFEYFKGPMLQTIKKDPEATISILPLFNDKPIRNESCEANLLPLLKFINLIMRGIKGSLLQCVYNNYTIATVPC